MKRALALSAALALLEPGLTARAAVNIETVTVGDPGNVADTRYDTPGYGSVGYTYNIGKYEVTAGQYTTFLNAVGGVDTYALYNAEMRRTDYGSGITRSGGGTVGNPYRYTVNGAFANRPVNYVSFWDACRFANWLNNGQPTGAQGAGTTETGAYTLSGYNGFDGGTISRNTGCEWAVTSEAEWYKAAYYKGGSTDAGYWTYPTRSDTVPGRDLNDASGNNANYWGTPIPIQSPYFTTIVGEFQNSDSAYGTFDQGGNVEEWNESIIFPDPGYSYRGHRGGAFSTDADFTMSGNSRGYAAPTEPYVDRWLGFRVVQVPEPTTMTLLVLGGIGIVGRRRRRGR
jgi:formylglycine-generating enzyme required for sulfatase activity